MGAEGGAGDGSDSCLAWWVCRLKSINIGRPPMGFGLCYFFHLLPEGLWGGLPISFWRPSPYLNTHTHIYVYVPPQTILGKPGLPKPSADHPGKWSHEPQETLGSTSRRVREVLCPGPGCLESRNPANSEPNHVCLTWSLGRSRDVELRLPNGNIVNGDDFRELGQIANRPHV